MLCEFEHLAVVNSRPFEHGVTVVKAVRQNMHFGVAPGHEFSVEPNRAVAIVEGKARRTHENAPHVVVRREDREIILPLEREVVRPNGRDFAWSAKAALLAVELLYTST